MDCKEAQRCIPSFLKDALDRDTEFRLVEHIISCSECMEELTVEYLLTEGISRLENAEDIDVQAESYHYPQEGIQTAESRSFFSWFSNILYTDTRRSLGRNEQDCFDGRL